MASDTLTYYRFVPASITDRAYWDAMQKRQDVREMLDVVAQTVPTLPDRPQVPSASDYLAAKVTRHNDRARTDRMWQNGRAELSLLALNRCMKGLDPSDYDDRLLDWLWEYLMHPTWTVSAHLPGNDLPASGTPTLDLASCEMACVMAEIRECLKPWMDSVSSTLADSIIYEIDRRILTPYAEGCVVRWENPEHATNWLGVCAGNILAACESLAAQGHPRPAARARALRGLQLFLDKGFTKDGECDEGLGYWMYGVGQMVTGLCRLTKEELEKHIDMDRLRAVAEYPRRIHLAGNLFFSGNDAGLRVRASRGFIPWLAAATGSQWLMRWAATGTNEGKRNFPMFLRALAAPPLPQDDAPLVPEDTRPRFLADQQVGIVRQSTPRGQMIVCLTGGHNAERHNHNDLGHFIVTLDDTILMPDLGAPHYTTDFFSDRRYTYLSASSRGHSCPLIDDIEQRPGRDAQATVVEWSDDPQNPRLVLELSAAYPPEAKLSRWTRSLERSGDGFVIRDVYRARPGARITHVLWSLPQITLRQDIGAGKVVAQMGPLACIVSPQPADVKVEPINPADHRLRDYDAMLHRLSASYTADDSGDLVVETHLKIG